MLARESRLSRLPSRGEAARLLLPRQFPHRTPCGAGGEGSIGLQRLGNVALSCLDRLPAGLVLGGAAGGQFGVADGEADGAVRDVDLDRVAVAHQTDRAAF